MNTKRPNPFAVKPSRREREASIASGREIDRKERARVHALMVRANNGDFAIDNATAPAEWMSR